MPKKRSENNQKCIFDTIMLLKISPTFVTTQAIRIRCLTFRILTLLYLSLLIIGNTKTKSPTEIGMNNIQKAIKAINIMKTIFLDKMF